MSSSLNISRSQVDRQSVGLKSFIFYTLVTKTLNRTYYFIITNFPPFIIIPCNRNLVVHLPHCVYTFNLRFTHFTISIHRSYIPVLFFDYPKTKMNFSTITLYPVLQNAITQNTQKSIINVTTTSNTESFLHYQGCPKCAIAEKFM